MRKAKKLISMLLTLCMVMALLPATASAADELEGAESELLSSDELGLLRAKDYVPEYVPTTPVTLNMTEGDGADDGIAPLSDTETGTPVTARYTVLVLDCSGSMGGQPMAKMKEAAQSFCDQMVKASSSNYVAFVPFDNNLLTVTPFTNDPNVMTAAVNNLSARGSTDINTALEKADELLRAVPGGRGTVKNIILLSDGLPNVGERITDGGRYKSNESSYYAYANACYETARDDLWTDYNVYTLGFLHNVGSEKEFCRRFLRDLANRLYYEVQDGDDLIFVFGDIVDEITTEDEDPILIIPGTSQTGVPAGLTDVRESGVQGTYKDLADSLCGNLDEREVYIFGYNPANSIADSAKELDAAITRVLGETESEKVDLVAHSTGGLVVSSYYTQYETVSYATRKVDKIITCGTPYEGVPEIIKTVSGTSLVSSSGYAEMAPTTQYVEKVPMYRDKAGWRRIDQLLKKNSKYELSTSQYEDAMRDIFPSYDSAKTVQYSLCGDGDDYNALMNYSRSYFAIGLETNKHDKARSNTITTIVFNDSDNSIDDLDYGPGDGTVPYVSATMMGRVNPTLYRSERWQRFNVDNHNKLVTSSGCIQWISEILKEGKGTAGTTDTTPIGVKINGDDYIIIRIACPVDVFVPGPGGELSSECTLTDFGRLDIIGSADDPVKMLCLDADTYDNILILGTDDGTMSLDVRYFDGAGTLVSEKALEEVDVKKGDFYSLVVPESKDGVVKLDGTILNEVEGFVPVEDEVTKNLFANDLERETAKPDVPTVRDLTSFVNVLSSVGGEVIPSARYAEAGERVTLTAHPEDKYETADVSVTDIRGRSLTLREVKKNQWSFVMPACDVKVASSFARIDGAENPQEEIPGTGHTTADPDEEVFTGLGTPGISGIVLNPAAMPFSDVRANDWFYNNVEYMWKHYLMSGVSDTQFSPNATTNRGMIWTIVARMNNVRTDINPGSTWYERGMLWAMEQGVTDGSNPMGDITREQLATMLWRNAGSPGGTGDLSKFSDSAKVSSYAVSAVRWAVGVGVLNGSNGKLNPQGTATRAEVAAMVARYGDKVA